jgi:DNA-binding helix-hairpin-helix protein with protein kinase domain
MQKSALLFDKYDAPVQVGKKLGTGGEGDVFELNDNLVAKVYHQPLPAIKQNKLMAMSSAHTPPLLEISTWPVGTVHLGKQGPVGGLIMPKLVGYKEIHKLYGPAHRKSEFPSADWSFLVQAARNTAAAITTLHQSGYVVGDINPSNLAVSASALTKLIDCDSFQVKFNGQHYACEVGVAHFTPPELQSKSFNNVIRTPNHDNFGLALLCFHLLFMGRHPFAGKYKDGKEDMSIERAIREFRFAYGVKSASKGMAAPPNTLPLTIVGSQLTQMFEAAFDQGGVFNGRPTASQWVKALDDLKTHLVICTKHPSHKFYRILSSCPWCTLEKQSGTVFFLLASPSRTRPSIDLGKLWQEVLAVTPLGPFYLPNFSFSPSPQPLPEPLLLLTAHSKDFVQEAERRRAAVVASETAWNDIQRRWSQEISSAEFSAKLTELKKVYGQLNALATKQKK